MKPDKPTVKQTAKPVTRSSPFTRRTTGGPHQRPATIRYQSGKNDTQMAEELNRAGFRTAMGCQFQATQVMRLIKRVQFSTI